MKENKTLDSVLEMVTALTIPLVRYPEHLAIDGFERGKVFAIEIRSHGADYGRLIGRAGSTINNLKVLAKAAGHGLKIVLTVAYPKVEADKREEWDGFKRNEHWKSGTIKKLALIVAKAVFGQASAVEVSDVGDTTIISMVPVETWVVDAGKEARKNTVEWALVEKPLNHVFHAIGKAMGRNEIVVTLAQEETK